PPDRSPAIDVVAGDERAHLAVNLREATAALGAVGDTTEASAIVEEVPGRADAEEVMDCHGEGGPHEPSELSRERHDEQGIREGADAVEEEIVARESGGEHDEGMEGVGREGFVASRRDGPHGVTQPVKIVGEENDRPTTVHPALDILLAVVG